MPDPAAEQPVPPGDEESKASEETSAEDGASTPPDEGGADTESGRRREIRERPQTRRITRSDDTRILRRPDIPDLQALADMSKMARESHLGLPSVAPASARKPAAPSDEGTPDDADESGVSETETPPAGMPAVTGVTAIDQPDPGAGPHDDTPGPIVPPPEAEIPRPPHAAAPAPPSPAANPPGMPVTEEWGDTASIAFQRSLLGKADIFDDLPSRTGITGATDRPSDTLSAPLADTEPADPEPAPAAPPSPAPGQSSSGSGSDDFLQRLDKEVARARQKAAEQADPESSGAHSLLTSPKIEADLPSPDTLAGLLLRPITRFFRRPRQRAPVSAVARQLVLSVQEVALIDGGRPVLDGVSFDVIPGEAVGIIGRNGSGKTALLKICAGIVRPASGLVLIDGIDPFHGKYRDRQQARRKIGYVFQDGTLISNISVYDNIAMPLRYHTPLDEESIARKVDIWLRRLDLTDIIGERPGNLPTNRARLVNLARALVGDPHILILDEPFAMLDRESSKSMTAVIRELKEAGTTVIIASTGGQRILDVADRFGALEDGQLARIDKNEIRRRGHEPMTAWIVSPSGRQQKVTPGQTETRAHTHPYENPDPTTEPTDE